MAGQNIKTNYKTPYDKDKAKEAVQKHSTERFKRRILRAGQQHERGEEVTGPTEGNLKAYEKYDTAKHKGEGGKVTRTTEGYSKREPDFNKHGKLSGDDEAVVYKKKKPVQTKTEKAKAWLKDRAEAISHNTRDIRPRGRGPSPHTTLGMGLPQNPDLFGVGGFGGGGGLHGMMGADPFHEMQPRRAPAPTPQKKKRKRKSGHRAPPAQAGGFPPMMGGIPKGMRWMFGQ